MKQIIQNMNSGETLLIDTPTPKASKGQLLIRTKRSLISAGTERMLVEFGKANILDKARQQPDKVKMVLEKVKTDGLLATVDAVRSKLGQPLQLGYCNVGTVQEVGSNVIGFQRGDRVASNGPHADFVRVPEKLCVKVPDSVDDESAAFTVLAAIGIQGIRLAQPSLGETFVVSGLGLVGLLTVQLLRAQGCRVLGIDFDEKKLAIARDFGADTVNLSQGINPVDVGISFSRGRGVDGVIIAASAKSSEPVSQAAHMCRKRGRIILVGVTGLELNRADFYEKELSFQVSCSYGPGRYDSNYEENGHDYPIGYVRWTEQRNFEAVLDMFADGKIDVKSLISHRYNFQNAIEGYKSLSEDKSCLGILLEYPGTLDSNISSEVRLEPAQKRIQPSLPVCGFIGAGNYASRVLIPAFKKAGAQLETIVSNGGLNCVHHGRKNGFSIASTDADSILKNECINTVAIVTRHNSHARYVTDCLKTGKHVFVEKPLALTLEQLKEVENTYQTLKTGHECPLLMIGFNRRFAPHIIKIKELLSSIQQPKSFIITVNAGEIPSDHWTQDPNIGGGRIIGEGCHFIDLVRFLAESSITNAKAVMIGGGQTQAVRNDKASITLEFADGSFGTIHYLANGNKQFPKERIEVFCAGRVLQLDNFKTLKGYGWPGFKKMRLWRQDKGQDACAAIFLDAIKNGKESPIPFEEIMEVSKIVIEINEQLISFS